jgi:chemotaxis protein CheC
MTEAEPFAPLSELERDAIAELANVAMGRAATSLRKMVGSEIMLSVPKVEILDVQAAAESLSTPRNAHFVAVRQDISGAISGRALLIFPGDEHFRINPRSAGASASGAIHYRHGGRGTGRDRQHHHQ